MICFYITLKNDKNQVFVNKNRALRFVLTAEVFGGVGGFGL